MLILKGHRYAKPVRSLAFSPDGRRLVSSARDYKTFLWDLGTGTYRRLVEREYSYTVAWSPDGRTIAVGGSHSLYLWTVETETKRDVELADEGYEGHALRVAFSPDGRWLAAASGVVRLWDAATLELLPLGEERRRATMCLAFSRDGKTLATGHSPRRAGAPDQHLVRLWDLAARRVRGELAGPTGTPDALSFSPDGRWLAAACGQTLWV
jgi:WD40 repeat protein